MNRSGAGVQALASFLRIAPAEMLVAHDEIDLPPRVVRLKKRRSRRHNGVRDVIAQLGADSGACALASHPGSKDQVIDPRCSIAPRPTSRSSSTRRWSAHTRRFPTCCATVAQKAMHRLHTRDETEK